MGHAGHRLGDSHRRGIEVGIGGGLRRGLVHVSGIRLEQRVGAEAISHAEEDPDRGEAPDPSQERR